MQKRSRLFKKETTLCRTPLALGKHHGRNLRPAFSLLDQRQPVGDLDLHLGHHPQGTRRLCPFLWGPRRPSGEPEIAPCMVVMESDKQKISWKPQSPTQEPKCRIQLKIIRPTKDQGSLEREKITKRRQRWHDPNVRIIRRCASILQRVNKMEKSINAVFLEISLEGLYKRFQTEG